MIDRQTCGLLPPKPHTAYRLGSGQILHEEMHTRAGFDGPFTYFYHLFPVTAARSTHRSSRGWHAPIAAPEGAYPLKRRLYDANPIWQGGSKQQTHAPPGPAQQPTGMLLDDRVALLFNDDLTLLLASPQYSDDMFFANNDGDELWFIRSGSAKLESVCGWLEAQTGDYVFVPRSLIHRWHPEKQPLQMLCLEAKQDCQIPGAFRNASGQLTMNAPYTHRDFARPHGPIATSDASPEGPSLLLVKRAGLFSEIALEHCPMDVVGWDGFVYPFAFAIEKFQPKTGQIHLPPTVHMTFCGPGFVICSFVPRLTDYHKDAIPCPYPHSNVHCDEVILYLQGNFTSRRGVSPGCISFHPRGIAHGPQPGAYEASIGTVRTDELAVMLDAFNPLMPTVDAVCIEDLHYHDSWKTRPLVRGCY